jgi:hypothetical protein
MDRRKYNLGLDETNWPLSAWPKPISPSWLRKPKSDFLCEADKGQSILSKPRPYFFWKFSETRIIYEIKL